MIGRKRLEIMKVRPEFKQAFKMAGLKQGFSKISEFSSFLTNKAAKEDMDIAAALCGKENLDAAKRKGESYFEIK